MFGSTSPTAHPPPWLLASKWTLLLSALVVVLNLGLFPWAPPACRDLLGVLQLDPSAVRHGEWYRLVTGNLVHWSRQHLYLDGAAFLVLGLLYERYLPWLYPWLLLGTALSVGVAGMWWLPEQSVMRGLSGVNAGQFAAAVCIEVRLARRDPHRWLWVGPAMVLFLTWLIYGSVTGRFFGGALFLQEGGKVAAWAHVIGAVAATTLLAVATLAGLWRAPIEGSARSTQCRSP